MGAHCSKRNTSASQVKEMDAINSSLGKKMNYTTTDLPSKQFKSDLKADAEEFVPKKSLDQPLTPPWKKAPRESQDSFTPSPLPPWKKNPKTEMGGKALEYLEAKVYERENTKNLRFTGEYMKLLNNSDKKPKVNNWRTNQNNNPLDAVVAPPPGLLLNDDLLNGIKHDLVDAGYNGSKKSLRRLPLREKGQKDRPIHFPPISHGAQKLWEAFRVQEETMQQRDVMGNVDCCREAVVYDDAVVERMNREEDASFLGYMSGEDHPYPSNDRRLKLKRNGSNWHRLVKEVDIRSYVTRPPTPLLDSVVATFLNDLRKLQDREQSLFPETASRRFQIGFREVLRSMRRSKAKAVIMAPDIEKVTTIEKQSLDTLIAEVLQLSKEKNIPVIFSMTRRRLGKAIGKSLRIAMISIVDTRGVDQLYNNILQGL